MDKASRLLTVKAVMILNVLKRLNILLIYFNAV